MTAPTSPSHTAGIIRAAEAEHLGLPGGSAMTLLADSHDTNGTLSIHQTVLHDGANGASPHHHTTATEVFYLLSGTAQILIGEQVHTARAGDLAVAPPGAAHAFAAAPGCDAEVLVAVAPGIERFDLFRRLARAAAGLEPPGTLFEDQAEYDTYAENSPIWHQARDLGQPPSSPTTKETP